VDNHFTKASILLALVLTLNSVIVAQSISAQSTPKPSVPEFTAKLFSPPAESQMVNRTIELTVKNQPSVSGHGFFYMVRARVNGGNWSLLYTIDNVPGRSSGEYTTFSYPSDRPVVEYQYYLGDRIQNLYPGDKADFQVQAMIGSIHRVYNPNHASQLDMYPYVFTGEVSDWSSTQTITIPDSSASASPNPPTSTVTPDDSPSGNPQLTDLALVAAVTILAVAVVFLLVYLRKIKNRLPEQ
jgi:hypothetical protein